jgi:hypothetical protein
MKIVVRVELITDWGDAKTVEVGRIERPSQMLDAESVGLSMADGKQLATGGDSSPRPTRSAPYGASAVDAIAGRR